MAKRRRLTETEIAALTPGSEAAPETKAMPRYPLGVAPGASRPPIAQVAGEAAAQAALDEVAGELKAAREEGRLVLQLPLDAIKADHLLRDRITQDETEMEALKESLRARGQQTPIEVVELSGGAGQGGYGLISGWRRLSALRALHAETGEAGFSLVQALVRRIDTAPEAYLAMVEENEIRVGLSFYERARLAAEAATMGLYRDPAAAVADLFARASRSKRSKIGSFIGIHERLGEALSFPAAIPEKLGLALAEALKTDPGLARRIRDQLRKTPPADATAERAALERALRKTPEKKPPAGEEVSPGIRLQAGRGRLVLHGPGVDATLQADLAEWLERRP